MIERVAYGELPAKHHLALRDGAGTLRYEHCLTRAGFDGPYTIAYHVNRPQGLTYEAQASAPALLMSENPLRRRHYRTQRLTGRRALLANADVTISVAKPTRSDEVYTLNGDADELWFVRAGRGVVRSVLGDLAFGPGDYVGIPRGILYRMLIDQPADLLLIECTGTLGIPAQWRNPVGQLRMDAPYCHRDFRKPAFQGPLDEKIRTLHVQRHGARHSYHSAHAPLDVVGWDGTLYPWAFPILAFQPRVSSVHLPPTWHGTFATHGALICSFVPRPLDFHPQAIPCPYPHSSADVDELIYYISGSFASRSGVEAGSLTLHPRGIPHGPQPGLYEASVGAKHTEEVAVMLDCYQPLTPTEHAAEVEDTSYEGSFS
ncbi:MAG TPA: homogentisate 1,2-dioxygenase [Polyangiales bacterium]|nr:homogentisate 1,2-dioxygenase [Polyangiales bacterium]